MVKIWKKIFSWTFSTFRTHCSSQCNVINFFMGEVISHHMGLTRFIHKKFIIVQRTWTWICSKFEEIGSSTFSSFTERWSWQDTGNKIFDGRTLSPHVWCRTYFVWLTLHYVIQIGFGFFQRFLNLLVNYRYYVKCSLLAYYNGVN